MDCINRYEINGFGGSLFIQLMRVYVARPYEAMGHLFVLDTPKDMNTF